MVEPIYCLKPAWCGRHLAGLRPETGLTVRYGATAFKAVGCHSAVSHNPNTLAGSFQLVVRRKHSPLAHVPVISTLRYPSWQLPRPNQQRRSCGGRGAGTCIPDLPVALPAAVAESTPRLDVRSR